jgi:DNA polymerase-3 subunit gamma/tau
MSLLSQAASRGVEWEALLVEMLRLLPVVLVTAPCPIAIAWSVRLSASRMLPSAARASNCTAMVSR